MARQALIILIVVVAFGILVPLYKGFGFLDARIIAAYACLALLFVAPASAEIAASQEKGATALAVLAKSTVIVAWGWGITVLILASAIVTLNVVHWRGAFAAPPLGFTASVLIFSWSASMMVAMFGALLARRFSAGVIKNILRTAFLVILLGLVFGARVLPDNVTLPLLLRLSTRRGLTHMAWQGAAGCGAIAALLLLILWKARPAGPFDNIRMSENLNEGGR